MSGFSHLDGNGDGSMVDVGVKSVTTRSALDKVGLQFSYDDGQCCLNIISECRVTHKTGVEMEALTAASIAALTIYDMCKALSHEIVIERVQLLTKSGGKSDFTRTDNAD